MKNNPNKFKVPMAPQELILDGKSPEEINAFIFEGVKDIERGNIYPIEDVLKMPKEDL